VGFLIYLNWKFALLSFSLIPVATLILFQLGKKSRRAGREGQERMADMYNSIHEGITAMPIVQTYQNEKRRYFGGSPFYRRT
jgi:ABC-type multidrug transport system fused ATPase/permease subunit